MPSYETPGELADWLADQLGIYGDDCCELVDYDLQHTDDCNCRVFWVPAMAERIRQAVRNEQVIGRIQQEQRRSYDIE